MDGASIIDGAINAGMNRVDSVQFDATNDTKSRMKEELVGKAIEDAQQKVGGAGTYVRRASRRRASGSG